MKKKVMKKLELNKNTIANLNSHSMRKVLGGGTIDEYSCVNNPCYPNTHDECPETEQWHCDTEDTMCQGDSEMVSACPEIFCH